MAIKKNVTTILRPSDPKNWLYKDVVLEAQMPTGFKKRIYAKEVYNEPESAWTECTPQEKDAYIRSGN